MIAANPVTPPLRRIWKVYATSPVLAVYVAADDIDDACRAGAERLGRAHETCVARYVLSSTDPAASIAALEGRRA